MANVRLRPERHSWWRRQAPALIEALADRDNAYVYQLNEITRAAERLKSMRSVGQVFFAMKANNNPDVLQTLNDAGVNFECVSPGEIDHVLRLFPDIDRRRILFTPNFAPRDEYRRAFAEGVYVTLDNLYPAAALAGGFRRSGRVRTSRPRTGSGTP